MKKQPFGILVVCLICLPWLKGVYGQGCPDPASQTSGSHRFSRQGEIIKIPILVADCQPISLELRWSNGRNNGSNFKVIFLDSSNQPIYGKELSGFQTGRFEFPFTTLEPQRWLGSRTMLFVPANITIEAVRPFAFPATISYTVTRVAGPSRRKPGLDQNVVMKLRVAAGRLLSQGQSLLHGNATQPITYQLEEVQLPEPRVLEIRGRRQTLEFAYRLTLVGGESLGKAELIWVDDSPLPLFRRRAEQSSRQEIGALIYDRSVLKHGAEIAVSESNGSPIRVLTELLTLPADFPTRDWLVVNDSERLEEGNAVVGIHSAVRIIGPKRQPLVQIELKTSRPFPPSNKALKVQIGRQFFFDELSGDHSGRRLTLMLTPEMFAELKHGAEIVAFYETPDRSGFSDQNIWHFGRLNKEMWGR